MSSENKPMSSEKSPEQKSEQFIREAVDGANISSLRVALYHQTKDPSLKAMESVEYPIRGGQLSVYSVPREYHQEIRDKAFQYLCSGAKAIAEPTRQESESLMKMFSGKDDASQPYLDYGYEELAFEDFPREATWKNKPDQSVLNDYEVTIVGAGFSGIAAAIMLSRLGIKFRIIERHSDLAGTWLINDYPEARVDVTSFVYQYKFEKNYPWSSFYAPREELKEYANFIVDKYDLRSKMTFNCELKSATWDEAKNIWNIVTEGPDGEQKSSSSNAVISASGLFNTPKKPDIPGIDTFEGAMFHTTEWDHSFDYAGKKVALIGTGSTGCQLSRGVAQTAQHLTIFQRSASWVTPVVGYHDKLSESQRWMLDNMPGYNNWFVYLNYIAELQMLKFQEIDPEWVAKGGHVNEDNAKFAESLKAFIRSKVGDRDDLYEKLIPKNVPMSRRLVIDNDWYGTIMRDNVSLETNGIKEITPNGIVTNDGVEHEFDLIILSAGFDASRYLLPAQYKGIDGVRLEDLWDKDGARAYKSVTLPGFPNLFMMYGPNGQARLGSFHSWAENFSRYICGLIAHSLENSGKGIVVKRSAYDDYNDALDTRMKTLLWETETGDSYYVNKHGRSGVNAPWDVHEFFAMVQSAEDDADNYDIIK